MKTNSTTLQICYWLIVFFLQFNQLNAQSFNKEEFAKRRQQLMQEMDGGIAIFKGGDIVERNDDIDYKFRQNSNFYYLTGFDEPGSACLLIPGAEKEFILFIQPKNPLQEMWLGNSPGFEEAMKKYGADTVYLINQFLKELPKYLKGKDKIYYSMNDEKTNEKVLSVFKPSWGAFSPKMIINPMFMIHELRLIKSKYEIELLQRAIDITCGAHSEAFKATKPGLFEYEIESIIEYKYLKNGSPRFAFPSIVGSGANSTILHYMDNNQQMKDGDVLLMDIGAEYGYYAADITRTIPVNGKFSKEQKEIYGIVLSAQKEGIAKIKPEVRLNEIENIISKTICNGLYELGLITEKNSDWQYRTWYNHGSSHWLGLDVHDVGSYLELDKSGSRKLMTGMVLTVEPGIYIGPKSLENIPLWLPYYNNDVSEEELKQFIEKVKPVAEKYMKIGIRIEDDVLVTNDGNKVLSAKAPKEIKEIETLMRKDSKFN